MEKQLKQREVAWKWLRFVMISVFLWGIVAHGYGFAQNSFSHDSLNEFNGELFGNLWKIQLGRFVIPVYRGIFRTDLTIPWLIGFLSLVWIGLAVFLVLQIFNIQSKTVAFLTAGIFVTNITVTATASTYMHDFDCDMFALLCAVMAVYLWQNVRYGAVFGSVFVVLFLGIYQSYVSVTIVLVMMVCIFQLLDGESFKTVFVQGMKAVGMLILGGILYYLVTKVAVRLAKTTLQMGEYNSLYTMFRLTPKNAIFLAADVYRGVYEWLTEVMSVYPECVVKGITFVLLLSATGGFVISVISTKVQRLEKLLSVCLVALLPLGMNVSHILTVGVSHDLMVYAVWLFYLLALLLAQRLTKWVKEYLAAHGKAETCASWPEKICMVLIAVLLYSNVQVANAVYLKKDQEYDATLSYMTRVMYRLEDYEGYDLWSTPVVFAGSTHRMLGAIPGFEKYYGMTGQWSTDTLDSIKKERYEAYFRYVLVNQIVFAEEEVWDAMQEDPRVAEMPSYPEDGCIAMIDDVLVFKLGDAEQAEE